LFRLDDPEYPMVLEIVNRTLRLSAQLNASGNVDQVRQLLSVIIGSPIDGSTTILCPFYTNFCRFIPTVKNVFV
jgi:hypothetical protein